MVTICVSQFWYFLAGETWTSTLSCQEERPTSHYEEEPIVKSSVFAYLTWKTCEVQSLSCSGRVLPGSTEMSSLYGGASPRERFLINWNNVLVRK